MIDAILEKKPENHIFNVSKELEQRNYFSFYNYEYSLDITKQKALLKETTDLEEGLEAAYRWYLDNQEDVKRKDFLRYIDEKLK